MLSYKADSACLFSESADFFLLLAHFVSAFGFARLCEARKGYS